MSSRRQPLMTLSPSQQAYHVNSSLARPSSLQTTPKLSRREKLASITRLLNSERFPGFISEKSSPDFKEHKKRRSRKFSQRVLQDANVTIRISSGSPVKEPENSPNTNGFFNPSGNRYLSPNNLPFSPRLLSERSPVCLSPSYRQPTPVKSPLYAVNNKGVFLGRGAFGNVTLCKYKDANFALKVIHHSVSYIGEKNLLGIRHPHLVEIFHISSVMNKTIICMEFAGHCNLQQILDTKSELDFPRRLSFCIQIALGLRHCHQQRIVHGDVKPANVIVSPLGICKLCDFGHSINLDTKSAGDAALSPEDVIGTVVYSAPEVLRGSRPSPLSDVYSFGILLWQVHSRETPFSGEHPHVVIYKVVHYGCRPKFEAAKTPPMSLFSETTQLCWPSDPKDRIDSNQVLSKLQGIMRIIKEKKENLFQISNFHV